MKKRFIYLVAATFIVITGCEKNSDSNLDNKKISFYKADLGGCNIDDSDNLKSAKEAFFDTVEFTLINQDTLNVFVGINYICCAPFIYETEIINDSLIIEINDTCSLNSESCYCWCMCYYTWDFKFIDFETKEYDFLIKLNDPREDKTIILKEGRIDLSK